METLINQNGPVILFILVSVTYPFAIKFIGGILLRIERRSQGVKRYDVPEDKTDDVAA